MHTLESDKEELKNKLSQSEKEIEFLRNVVKGMYAMYLHISVEMYNQNVYMKCWFHGKFQELFNWIMTTSW